MRLQRQDLRGGSSEGSGNYGGSWLLRDWVGWDAAVWEDEKGEREIKVRRDVKTIRILLEISLSSVKPYRHDFLNSQPNAHRYFTRKRLTRSSPCCRPVSTQEMGVYILAP